MISDASLLAIGPVPRAFTLRVDLGETVAELRSPDREWITTLKRRYLGFVTTASPNLVVRHQPDRFGPPVESSPSAHEVGLNADAGINGVDSAIRRRLPELAAPALVAHGTLLSDGPRGYLCCGPSGAGKSTLAAMLPERALCDELALVRPADGGFESISLPYWIARPGCISLAGIFLLEHAPEHHRQRLTPSAAIRDLKSNICWPTISEVALRNAFATLTDLATSIPVWRLGFARDPSVWQMIAAAA